MSTLDYSLNRSSHGGLEVEQWTDNRTLSILMVTKLAWRQKDFRSNSNTTGGALVNKFFCLGVNEWMNEWKVYFPEKLFCLRLLFLSVTGKMLVIGEKMGLCLCMSLDSHMKKEWKWCKALVGLSFCITLGQIDFMSLN